uniref:NADH dehydrogenase subunit 6 n=1 Tax=Choerocoris paganus TaxID=468237 RepID=A0A2P1CMN2_9HEMI|nr:NADH dehydrogenase subunit 6 [Choerocoris paganus]
MTTMLYSLLITVSMMFLLLKHPMSMGFILILQTMIIAIISGMMLNNFFFSYIIMIIMLSGALVLFIYMASVASNEKFKTSTSMMIMTLMTFLASLPLTKDIKVMEHPNKDNYMSIIMTLSKLFNTMSTYMTMMMIMYLLLTMIVVSYIANTQEGPLRVKTYE